MSKKSLNSSGDATCLISDVSRLAGFFICELALDDKSLSDVRKVQIAVEFGCGPDFANFDAAVIRRVELDKIGILAVLKI